MPTRESAKIFNDLVRIRAHESHGDGRLLTDDECLQAGKRLPRPEEVRHIEFVALQLVACGILARLRRCFLQDVVGILAGLIVCRERAGRARYNRDPRVLDIPTRYRAIGCMRRGRVDGDPENVHNGNGEVGPAADLQLRAPRTEVVERHLYPDGILRHAEWADQVGRRGYFIEPDIVSGIVDLQSAVLRVGVHRVVQGGFQPLDGFAVPVVQNVTVRRERLVGCNGIA